MVNWQCPYYLIWMHHLMNHLVWNLLFRFFLRHHNLVDLVSLRKCVLFCVRILLIDCDHSDALLCPFYGLCSPFHLDHHHYYGDPVPGAMTILWLHVCDPGFVNDFFRAIYGYVSLLSEMPCDWKFY